MHALGRSPTSIPTIRLNAEESKLVIAQLGLPRICLTLFRLDKSG
jgi:hypothetical protein